MKMSFLVCNSFYEDRLMKLLKDNDIDYFTSWDKAKGKGHGTEPHLGTASHGSTNSVFMIAFEDEAVLDTLVAAIGEANREIRRSADRIRLFQLPLDRIV